MILQQRIEAMNWLGEYMRSDNNEWKEIKFRASLENPWFTPEFIDKATSNIADSFLQKDDLYAWAQHYSLDDNIQPRKVGIVMAGNIPLVGFHDMLATFISGHKQQIKLSSKDEVLLKHLIEVLKARYPGTRDLVNVAENLKGSDAFIATGSNNSSRYFEQYFGAYPNIIRRNKTSMAVLDGSETKEELDALSDDIHLYFGLGCRSISSLAVPAGFDFIPLLKSFDRYAYFMDNHKYKSNYDYQLSLMLMNNLFYMTNGSTLLKENPSPFSAISVVHYQFYNNAEEINRITSSPDLQCIEGRGFLPFGISQEPGLFTYADGVDTMQFLLSL